MRDAQARLAEKGVAVAGISPDDPKAQKKFDEKYKLNFPLLSDGDRSVARSYGTWGEKVMYGRKIEGVIRSLFLIDEEGKIIQAWYKITPHDTVPKVFAALSEKDFQKNR